MALSQNLNTEGLAGGTAPSQIDNQFQNNWKAFIEYMNDWDGNSDAGDHYFPLTGTQVVDTDVGEHRKVTLRTGSAPTQRADTITVYAKDVSGVAELHAIDENGNEIQLTSGGATALGHTLTAKTSDYTVTSSDVNGNTTFTNTGAGGEVIFTLPAGSAGDKVRFMVTAAQQLRIQPDGSEIIRLFTQTTTALNYIRTNTIGAMISLIFSNSNSEWIVHELAGVWDEGTP